MPISGPNSYPATMSQFIQHWTDLNVAIGTPLVLSGTRNVALLTTWLDTVQTRISETMSAVLSATNRKGELDVMKANLISWTVIFNATVRADHGTLSYARNLQNAPQQSAGRGQFVEPLVKTQQIWNDLNAATGTDIALTRRRTLPNGTLATETLELADYVTLIDAMQEQWNAWTRAQQAAENIREQRNDAMQLAYDAMRDYRLKVPLELPPGHALLDSLPSLSPDSGATPDAPEATAAWNPATEQADLAATPSTTPEVDRHELRFSPEDPYNAENEIVLTTIPAGQPLTHTTSIGLAIPGDTARFSWVALTPDGRESRSNITAVTRV